jgi:hypothetical protein
MKPAIGFVLGALAASLLAATAFRGGGQPVDSTFTYQGQLRSAGQLVNGNVDVRFTLWDSATGGTQIGNANAYTNYPLTDGRFALGLNFGSGAFNGDQRWVQVEFRSPAGVGQYLTLNPRDKIVATPYALYALNGVESQWDYNPKSQALTTGENVNKVGIGTSSPTALLEVAGSGGDDAVKLPAGSIGVAELASLPRAWSVGSTPITFQTTVAGQLVLLGNAGVISYGGGSSGAIVVDGVGYGFPEVTCCSYPSGALNVVIPLSPGAHTMSAGGGWNNTAVCIWLPTSP